VKKIWLVIWLLILVMQLFAQKQKVNYMTTFDEKILHFGFTLGINSFDFGLSHYNPLGSGLTESEINELNATNWFAGEERITKDHRVRADVTPLIPGFTVGIVSSLRLHKNLDLRFLPGLSFGERQLVYNYDVVDLYSGETDFYSIKSTFLDFPLLIKYKANRINNNRPYIVFGPAFRQDISRTGRQDLVRLSNGGFYAEVGAGWDHYFPFFRFSIEAKMSLGLHNQLAAPPEGNQRQYYSKAIKELRSNIFTLLVHFE
jgi:hypothetical protein